VDAALGIEILVLNHAETTALSAAAGKAFDLNFQASNAVAFSLFFFGHCEPPFFDSGHLGF